VHDTVATRSSETGPLSEIKRRLLQQYLGGDFGQNRQNDGAITRGPSEEPAPLSRAQEQVWRHEMAAPEVPPYYNESITIHRQGPLDRATLTSSLTEIVRRHQIWRTSYDVIDGHLVQVVHSAPSAVSVPVLDLRQLPKGARETETFRAANQDAGRPFDLKRIPLLRFLLVTLSDEEHRLFITMHQSIVDGVSVYQVFPLELTKLYDAFASGNPSPLPELQVQYADFARWERSWLKESVLDGQLSYWRQQLSGKVETLHWPSRRPRSRTFRGVIYPFDVSQQLTAALKQLSQQEGVTLFMTLTAGFVALLHHYTRQDNIAIGTVGPAGRKRSEVGGLLGYFLNPLVLRVEVSPGSTFRELLQQVREVVLGALSHDDVPFEYVVREVDPESDPSRHPLFQVAISLAPSVPELSPGWKQTVMDVQSGGSKWDLYLEFSERLGGLMGRAQYNPDVFQAETIERTLQELQNLLGEATLKPGQPLVQLLESISDDAGQSGVLKFVSGLEPADAISGKI
jgi:surfactin family lipopeptide synthetase A